MGIECFRCGVPEGHGRERIRAQGDSQRRRACGVLLNKAEWLGKGQRPEQRIVEPVVVIESSAEIEPEPIHSRTSRSQRLKKKPSKKNPSGGGRRSDRDPDRSQPEAIEEEPPEPARSIPRRNPKTGSSL